MSETKAITDKHGFSEICVTCGVKMAVRRCGCGALLCDTCKYGGEDGAHEHEKSAEAAEPSPEPPETKERRQEPAPHFVIAAAIVSAQMEGTWSGGWPEICQKEAGFILDQAEALQDAANERYGS